MVDPSRTLESKLSKPVVGIGTAILAKTLPFHRSDVLFGTHGWHTTLTAYDRPQTACDIFHVPMPLVGDTSHLLALRDLASFQKYWTPAPVREVRFVG